MSVGALQFGHRRRAKSLGGDQDHAGRDIKWGNTHVAHPRQRCGRVIRVSVDTTYGRFAPP
jgi:hypothetical protein